MASSPGKATTRSTAGPGSDFEDQVAASILLHFLAGDPVLTEESLALRGVAGDDLFMQTRALGWLIDDLLCTGREADGSRWQIAFSCKSNPQVSAKGLPADFARLVWRQWRQGPPFNQRTDHLVLVTRGRHIKFDEKWSDLKTWCSDGTSEPALSRINESARHRTVFESLKGPGSEEFGDVTDTECLTLLRSVHVLPVDFQLHASRLRKDAISSCRRLLDMGGIEDARELWKTLVAKARAERLGSGKIALTDLWNELRRIFRLRDHADFASDWSALRALSDDYRSRIETALPTGHVIDRSALTAEFLAHLEKQAGCIVSGESGAGKSALVLAAFDRTMPEATQIWLDPDTLGKALSEAERRALGLSHRLSDILNRSRSAYNVLIIDAAERLDELAAQRTAQLLATLRKWQLASASSWWMVIIARPDALGAKLQQFIRDNRYHRLEVPPLESNEVQAALRTSVSLRWIAAHAEILPLISNPRTLAWVMQASGSFEAKTSAFESPSAIADRLWGHWTADKLQYHRLLIRLADREASYEGSFPLSEMDPAEVAALDAQPRQLPLVLNNRNCLEFRHDLASDWARFQRLKEIGGDIPRWVKLAEQPLWIPALRMFGQFLLREHDQDQDGWDHAFRTVQAISNQSTSDVLLDALCLDPHADRYLAERIELLSLANGTLLNRLLTRFLLIATTPFFPEWPTKDHGVRMYLEARHRRPALISHWFPMESFVAAYTPTIAALASSAVARLCATWLNGMPLEKDDGEPMPLRLTFAKLALETARTLQIQRHAYRDLSGRDESLKAIYLAALYAAADLPDEIAEFALEMAGRRALRSETKQRIEDLQHEEQARPAKHRSASAAVRAKQNARQQSDMSLSMRRPLPPWPLGPSTKLDRSFRECVIHSSGLTQLMLKCPTAAAEVLLGCIVDDDPTEECTLEPQLHLDLGIHTDADDYPTIYWKSPFYVFLRVNHDTALDALIQLVDFCTERWADGLPSNEIIPPISLRLSDEETRVFRGGRRVFGWSQFSFTSNGQLYCALDALEQWICSRLDEGKDIRPTCQRLLDRSSSTATLGVLVNVGKRHPALFEDVLSALLQSASLYFWDDHRVEQSNMAFDAMTWVQEGEAIFETAKHWVMASHRKVRLREIASKLIGRNASLASKLSFRGDEWEVPVGEKRALELRILKAELDPANISVGVDPVTNGISYACSYPRELQQDIAAYHQEAWAGVWPTYAIEQVEKIIQNNGPLPDETATKLAALLHTHDDGLLRTDERRLQAAAAAALLIRAPGWLKDRPELRTHVLAIVQEVINRVGKTLCELRDHERLSSPDALKFAAQASVALLNSGSTEAHSWILIILTSRNHHAIEALMRAAYPGRRNLGPIWLRLLQLGLMASALSALAPRFEDPSLEKHWNRNLRWLRGRSLISGQFNLHSIDPVALAERVERLCRARRRRSVVADADWLPSPMARSRCSSGLDLNTIESLFAWFFDVAPLPEGEEQTYRVLFARLWALEMWRAQGDADDHGEHDPPSQLGYMLLQRAPSMVINATVAEGRLIWEPIIEVGPEGHSAVQYFIECWFLQLSKPLDVQAFFAHWLAMLEKALSAAWDKSRRWYYGRQLMIRLLGLRATEAFSHSAEATALINQVENSLRLWATSFLKKDEAGVQALSHFLAADVGSTFRLEGVLWLLKAIQQPARISQTTGEVLAETMSVLLEQHPKDLLIRDDVRDAVAAIILRLVADEVPIGLALQQRMAALR